MHELAHLIEFHHNAKFLALVDQYPKAERARGFLTGVHYAPEGHNDGKAVDDADDAHDSEDANEPEEANSGKAAEVAATNNDSDYRPTLF